MITWSRSVTPTTRPAADRRCVSATSSGLGAGSPDGWLWNTTTEAAARVLVDTALRGLSFHTPAGTLAGGVVAGSSIEATARQEARVVAIDRAGVITNVGTITLSFNEGELELKNALAPNAQSGDIIIVSDANNTPLLTGVLK